MLATDIHGNPLWMVGNPLYMEVIIGFVNGGVFSHVWLPQGMLAKPWWMVSENAIRSLGTCLINFEGKVIQSQSYSGITLVRFDLVATVGTWGYQTGIVEMEIGWIGRFCYIRRPWGLWFYPGPNLISLVCCFVRVVTVAQVMIVNGAFWSMLICFGCVVFLSLFVIGWPEFLCYPWSRYKLDYGPQTQQCPHGKCAILRLRARSRWPTFLG